MLGSQKINNLPSFILSVTFPKYKVDKDEPSDSPSVVYKSHEQFSSETSALNTKLDSHVDFLFFVTIAFLEKVKKIWLVK